MLNIKENESYNNFVITGTLSTIDIKEGRSKSTEAYPQGRDYVRVNAMVRLDQEINGVLTQCEVPIELYANKDYSKGDVNPIYTNGQKFKDFISSISFNIDYFCNFCHCINAGWFITITHNNIFF